MAGGSGWCRFCLVKKDFGILGYRFAGEAALVEFTAAAGGSSTPGWMARVQLPCAAALR
ncbi:MAG: hypothetical protein U0992_06480 [Planctomycetaceae bacterium]